LLNFYILGDGDCPAPIVIFFKDLQGLEFRNNFLQQFLPWMFFSEFSAPCLEFIGNAAGEVKTFI